MAKCTVLVYGPPGCGKTHNMRRIADYFGVRTIIDGWSEGEDCPHWDTLLLTNTAPERKPHPNVLVVNYENLPTTLKVA